MIMKKIRTYKELSKIQDFNERFEYLKLSGKVAYETFGVDRYINQCLYNSPEWKSIRNKIIVRDNGCEMGHPDFPINGKIIVHHMNPLTLNDIENANSDIFNPEYLICVSQIVHNAIHYGDATLLPKNIIERKPGDTKLW